MSSVFPYLLVPCERNPWPELRPFYDLFHSLSMAQRITEKIAPFFRLVPEAFVLNGLARESEPQDGLLLYVQFWDEGKLCRTAAFRNIGFVGTVNVEARDDSYGIDDTLDQDVIACVHFGLTQTRFIGPGYESSSICYVDGEDFTIRAPWKV